MRNYKSGRIMILIILIAATVLLGVGFSYFSTYLSISGSAIVTPDSSDFNVTFSSSASSTVLNNITPTVSGGATANPATIDATTLSNINVTFSEPGQSATYKVFVRNIGAYDAYLKKIEFENAQNSASNKNCVPMPGTTASSVVSACESMSITVEVNNKFSNSLVTASNTTNIVNNIKIPMNFSGGDEVSIIVQYASNGDRSDGDFSVYFGDISLEYSSVPTR